MQRRTFKRMMIIIISVIILLFVAKGLWVSCATSGHGSFETVTWFGKSHYWLANWALVGEAITLAMRTSAPQTRM